MTSGRPVARTAAINCGAKPRTATDDTRPSGHSVQRTNRHKGVNDVATNCPASKAQEIPCQTESLELVWGMVSSKILVVEKYELTQPVRVRERHCLIGLCDRPQMASLPRHEASNLVQDGSVILSTLLLLVGADRLRWHRNSRNTRYGSVRVGGAAMGYGTGAIHLLGFSAGRCCGVWIR